MDVNNTSMINTTIRPTNLQRFKPCPHWRQFVAEFGDSRRFWRQSPNSATIVASVDMALPADVTSAESLSIQYSD